MSTYRWMLCDKCHEHCRMSSDLPCFFTKHKQCLSEGRIRMVSEHDEEIMDDYDEKGLNGFQRENSAFRVALTIEQP